MRKCQRTKITGLKLEEKKQYSTKTEIKNKPK